MNDTAHYMHAVQLVADFTLVRLAPGSSIQALDHPSLVVFLPLGSPPIVELVLQVPDLDNILHFMPRLAVARIVAC